jgi:hypothetical protein
MSIEFFLPFNKLLKAAKKCGVWVLKEGKAANPCWKMWDASTGAYLLAYYPKSLGVYDTSGSDEVKTADGWKEALDMAVTLMKKKREAGGSGKW